MDRLDRLSLNCLAITVLGWGGLRWVEVGWGGVRWGHDPQNVGKHWFSAVSPYHTTRNQETTNLKAYLYQRFYQQSQTWALNKKRQNKTSVCEMRCTMKAENITKEGWAKKRRRRATSCRNYTKHTIHRETKVWPCTENGAHTASSEGQT